MIKWHKVVNEVNKSLIKNKVDLFDAYVGDFEFGGLSVTKEIIVNVSKETGVIVIVDAVSFMQSAEPSTSEVKPTIKWLDFVNHIEGLCIKNQIHPVEVALDHLEIRPKSINDLSIFVDKKFKSLSITDGEDRINGNSLSSLLDC